MKMVMIYKHLLLKVNSINFISFCLILIYLETIRKELKPLTIKVEYLHKTHNKRYNHLKTVKK